jgi:hypothetical protein
MSTPYVLQEVKTPLTRTRQEAAPKARWRMKMSICCHGNGRGCVQRLKLPRPLLRSLPLLSPLCRTKSLLIHLSCICLSEDRWVFNHVNLERVVTSKYTYFLFKIWSLCLNIAKWFPSVVHARKIDLHQSSPRFVLILIQNSSKIFSSKIKYSLKFYYLFRPHLMMYMTHIL